MKKLFLFLMFGMLVLACSKDETDPGPGGGGMEMDECDNTNFTFTSNVQSIINTNCAISGCHVDGNNGGLPSFQTYQGVFNRRSGVSSRVAAKTMPPSNSGLSLSDAEIMTITCWVSDGAPE